MVVLGKSLLDFMPFRVFRWVVRRVGKAHGRGAGVMRLRSLREGGPGQPEVIHPDVVEERESCEDAEQANEVKGELPVSPWDNQLDSIWGDRGQDGRTHATCHSVATLKFRGQALHVYAEARKLPAPNVLALHVRRGDFEGHRY